MANVHITFRDYAQVGASSIPDRDPRAAETLTSSGTSAQTTITAKKGEMAMIATDGTIYIKIGSNPTAVTDDGDMLTAGVYQFANMRENDKVAIKDV